MENAKFSWTRRSIHCLQLFLVFITPINTLCFRIKPLKIFTALIFTSFIFFLFANAPCFATQKKEPPSSDQISGAAKIKISTENNKGKFTVFGPKSYYKGTSKSFNRIDSFQVLNPDANYFIKAQTKAAIKSPAQLKIAVGINGQSVIGEEEFFRNDRSIEKPITLKKLNELSVDIIGEPAGEIEIEIYGKDKQPPQIRAVVSPQPNEHGWNTGRVTVSFSCQDSVSGILECAEAMTVENETKGKTITGTAIDRAGNKTSTSVIIKIDRQAPIIESIWPPEPKFSTNHSSIEFEGKIIDSISGVHYAYLHYQDGKKSIKNHHYLERHKLNTTLPDKSKIRKNEFKIEAVDFAGHRTTIPFVVRYTKGITMLPTDPSKTEKVDGRRLSVNRALIRFAPSVERDKIYSICRQAEGRIAGYLEGSNTALVIFRTEHVKDLTSILEGIRKNKNDIIEARPVIFWEPQEFDNNLLPSHLQTAYRSVKLPEAEQFILDNFCSRCHGYNPVGVAIIDSGLDTSFGLDNEFHNVRFFDLCQLEGLQGLQGAPVDDTGHGTKMTGIIAGANNGQGNNGIVSGISESDIFNITVFRTQCGADADGFDGALITAAMEMIVEDVIPDIEVVNLSFGLASSDPVAKAWMASFYKPYFLSQRGMDIMWVASAGNHNTTTACDDFLTFPAGLACELYNVISVGGFEPNSLNKANTSNHGPAVTIFAPGENVYTSNAINSYGFVGHTSAATAVVTGAAALIKAFRPQPVSLLKHRLSKITLQLNDPLLTQGGLDIFGLIQLSGIPSLNKEYFDGDSDGGEKVLLLGDRRLQGLTGFGLNFKSSDHHLKNISAGSFSLDDPNPNITMWSKVEYSDKNGDDDYGYRLDMQNLPAGTTYGRTSKCDDFGDGGSFLIGEIRPGTVPVLTGFSFWRNDTDRHVDKITAQVSLSYGNYLYTDIAYEDKSAIEEPFCWLLEYALVPADRVENIGAVSGNSSGGSDEKTLNATNPILQGFKLDFDSADHHVDQVGVRVEPNKASVWYNDDNNDDDFSWKIWWVDVR